ncbi:4491_t:CDS:2 [Acaulospora colombiana]|uniref:4491_t:CDS:1 n=1 Tax=Acaulospora colombiana TaxID=27376 RepID=A0ACA9LGA6_9GLOM|nr:4491_t:CDS:2 [Acaulospora colombiana]
MKRGNVNGTIRQNNLEGGTRPFLREAQSLKSQFSYSNTSQFVAICKNSNCQNELINGDNVYCSMICQANDWSQPFPTFNNTGCFPSDGSRPIKNHYPQQPEQISWSVTRPTRNDNGPSHGGHVQPANYLSPKVHDGNIFPRPMTVFQPNDAKPWDHHVNDDDIQISCQVCFYFTSPSKNNCDLCGAMLRQNGGQSIINYPQSNCAPSGWVPLECASPPQPPQSTWSPHWTLSSLASQQTPSKDNWSISDLSSTTILCSSCGFMNSSFHVRCEVCDANLQNHDLNHDEEYLYEGVEIQCPSCYSFNDPRNNQCKVCCTSLKSISSWSELSSSSGKPDYEIPDLIIMAKSPDNRQQGDCNIDPSVGGDASGMNIYRDLTSKSPCSRKKRTTKTQMVVLSEHDQDYIDVRRLFSNGLPLAKIHSIIRLQMPNKLVTAHENYKKEIALQCMVPMQNNTYRMFHGMWFASSSEISFGYCGISSRQIFDYDASLSKNLILAMFVVDVVTLTPGEIIIVDKNAVNR